MRDRVGNRDSKIHRDRGGWRNERKKEKEKENKMAQAERKSKTQKKRHSENSIREVMISEKSEVQIFY